MKIHINFIELMNKIIGDYVCREYKNREISRKKYKAFRQKLGLIDMEYVLFTQAWLLIKKKDKNIELHRKGDWYL
jgi:hypothetical protein